MARYLPQSGYDAESARERIGPIVRALAKAYPKPETALSYDSPFQLLVAVILSAQSTDEQVNRTTPALFARFPTPEDLSAADPEEVEKLIYSTGFFRQKTKAIIGTAKALVERFGGGVPLTMDELTSLPGVARKTANVVLSSVAPKSDHGIFVDTHVRRVSQRLALTAHDDPDKIERDLMRLLPKAQWPQASLSIILHGRRVCDARRPRCTACVVEDLCPSSLAANCRDKARQAVALG